MEEMRRRIFVAALVPSDIRRSIDRVRRPWTGKGVPIKWVETENIHITLGFFGAITDRVLVRVSDAVSRAAALISPFPVRIGEPHIFAGRVVLYSLDAPKFKTFQQALRKIPGKFSTPHLTLGRIKGQIQNTNPILRALSKITESTFPVDRIAIVESNLRSTGPLYTIVEQALLGGHRVLRPK